MRCDKCRFLVKKFDGVDFYYCKHPSFNYYEDKMRPLPGNGEAPVFCPKKRKKK